MNPISRKLLVVVAVGLLYSLTASAQSIVGNVSTTFGFPIPGVLVTATRTSGGTQVVTDTTDASGNFAMATGLHPTPASYNVVPSKAGYIFTPASSNVTVLQLTGNETANFTTPATVPSAMTQGAQNVTATSGTLRGSVNPEGAATRAWFKYGMTTNYGSLSSSTNLGSGTAWVSVEIMLGSLVNGTNYHFCVVASNSLGITIGVDSAFPTPSGIPSVTTLDPTGGGTTIMTLEGSVNPNGDGATAWFEWGATTNYGNTTVTQNLGNGVANAIFGQGLTGLVTATSYHYRAVARTSFATNYGADSLFTPLFNNINAGLTNEMDGSVAWGDYDNDDRLDVVETGLTSNSRSELWRNTATGFVHVAPLFPAEAGSVAWCDYDHDGALDLLITGDEFFLDNPSAKVLRNAGTNGFVILNAGLTGIDEGSAAWGDFDNDGRPDILLAGNSSSLSLVPVSQLWRNTGSGFANVNVDLPQAYSSSLAWGDFDNDGRLDILIAGTTNGSLGSGFTQVWRNTGDGFTNINAGLPGVSAPAVAWGDFDNDGRLDILVAGRKNTPGFLTTAEVWRNTGNGFTNINAGLPGVYLGSVAWGDYDNDGRLDILLAGSSDFGPITEVWHNTGSGFVNINAGLPALDTVGGHNQAAVAWGDYDNDGRLDILLSGATSFSLPLTQIWKNNSPQMNTPPTGPSGLVVSVSNAVASLLWSPASDNETPSSALTYNLRVGTTPGGIEVVAPMAGTNGHRRLPQMGNAQESLTGQLVCMPGTTYYWSVQAVDAAFAGSAFSTEASFSVPLLPVVTNCGASKVLGTFATLNATVTPQSAPTTVYFQWGTTAAYTSNTLGQTINDSSPLAVHELLGDLQPGTVYHFRAVAFNTAGTAYGPDETFYMDPSFIAGDLNGDGIVDQNELDGVLSNYWPYSPWLYMTNIAGLGGTNVTFALTNSTAGAFSVEYTTNFMDWFLLGPAAPRYLFTDTNAPAIPQRSYRLRWP